MLEAKLVTPNGFAFSLMSEFIENPGPHPTKQDCELKAFYRLAKRLHHRFPRLPICLAMDGLYAGGPTFKLVQDCGWKFMITLKDADLPALNAEFEAVANLANQGGRIRWKIENEGFNVQKNGGFELEHAYAQNRIAAKNFYFLLQIAHAIFQLLAKGSLLKNILPQHRGSQKDLAFLILEAWRNATITEKTYRRLQTEKFQVRFDSS